MHLILEMARESGIGQGLQGTTPVTHVAVKSWLLRMYSTTCFKVLPSSQYMRVMVSRCWAHACAVGPPRHVTDMTATVGLA